jgi:putative hydrolase of the HAD superfamily
MKIICFDVGGVLVKISQKWQEAFDQANLECTISRAEPLLLPACQPMNEYQSGQIEYAEYLTKLGDFLNVSPVDAERLHQSILQVEYPGIPQLVADLKAAGYQTAILSNTNAPHWDDLLNPAKFPTVAAVDAPHASHLLGLGKPDPAIYAAFNEATGTEPADVVFFDDSQTNVDSANQFGWLAHRIDPWGDPAAQMRQFLTEKNLI